MKYLALLRDSFREALDSKMLYFTLGLSLLLIVLLSSLSFRPLSARDQAEVVVDFLNFFFWSQEQMNPKQTRMEIAECQQLNPDEDPWKGDYRIVLVVDIPKDMNDAAKLMAYHIQTTKMIQEYFWWMKDRRLDVKREKEGHEISYILTNHGTKIDSSRSWRHAPSLFFGLAPLSAGPFTILLQSSLSYSVYWIEDAIVSNVGAWVIILIGIIVTAGIIPNMMEKGSIDLLLVKPISRPVLLLFKYVGGLIFVFVNSVVAIGGVWLILGLRTGIWSYSFLVSILIITFFFAIYYSVSVLIGVLTRNSLIAILVTCLVWGLFFALSYALGLMDNYAGVGRRAPVQEVEAGGQMDGDLPRARPEVEPSTGNVAFDAMHRGLKTLHNLLPRTDDLNQLNSDLLSHELFTQAERKDFGFELRKPVNIWETLGVSLAFIAILMGLACWRFTVRDY